MARNIETQHGILARQPFLFAPWRRVAQYEANVFLGGAAAAKESVLAGLSRSRSPLNRRQCIVYRRQHGLSRPHRIHRSRSDQALEYPLVQKTGLNSLAKIVKRFKVAAVQLRLTNRL